MSRRIRAIKPEVLEDDTALSLSDAAWRLWVSLWVCADDYGNVRFSERYIATNVWGDTTKDVREAMAEVVAAKRVEPYEVRGETYANLRNFTKHQRIDNKGKPRVPTPEEGTTRSQVLAARFAANLREPPQLSASNDGVAASFGDSPLRAIRPPEGKGRERKGGEGEPAATSAAPAPPTKRGSRLPEDWQPKAETLERFRAREGVDASAVVERFKNHWLSSSGKNAVKLDWDRAFTNWVIDDIGRGKVPPWTEPEPATPPPPQGELVPMPAHVRDRLLSLSQPAPLAPVDHFAGLAEVDDSGGAP